MGSSNPILWLTTGENQIIKSQSIRFLKIVKQTQRITVQNSLSFVPLNESGFSSYRLHHNQPQTSWNHEA
jgi:hypothetical protein